jgi:hypothetical protein
MAGDYHEIEVTNDGVKEKAFQGTRNWNNDTVFRFKSLLVFDYLVFHFQFMWQYRFWENKKGHDLLIHPIIIKKDLIIIILFCIRLKFLRHGPLQLVSRIPHAPALTVTARPLYINQPPHIYLRGQLQWTLKYWNSFNIWHSKTLNANVIHLFPNMI